MAGPEQLIARLKPRDISAHRLDPTRHILSPNTGLRRAEPADEADQVRLARHEVPVADEDARRVDADEHLVVADHRHVDVPEVQHVCRAVGVLDDRFHGVEDDGVGLADATEQPVVCPSV
jgi:hypothetical protein